MVGITSGQTLRCSFMGSSRFGRSPGGNGLSRECLRPDSEEHPRASPTSRWSEL